MLGGVIVIGTALLVGIAMLVTSGRPMLKALAARSWEQTTGTVLSSEATVTPAFPLEQEVNRCAAVTVRYSYHVSGNRLLGVRENFFGRFPLNMAMRPKYHAGESVVVWYDPNNPEDAVLDKSVSVAGFAWFALSLAWLWGILHILGLL